MNIKVAVVGAGYWGKNLIRNFFELGALKAICDNSESLNAGYREKYPDITVVRSYEEVLADPSIDGIVLATPAATHAQLAEEALAEGKHVYVEKPLALTVEEGKMLAAMAGEKKTILMVGHILQYHNAVIKLKVLIDSGELGKIQYIYSNRLSIGKIRTEENILWSFAPHDISIILMLLGEMPNTVYATGGNYLQQQVADVTMTTMDFPSGVKAHIFVSWLHPFKEQKLVVVGDKKMAVFDDLSQEKLFLYPHKIEWLHRIPVASKAEAEVVPVEMSEPLKAECRHFLDCIQNGSTPKTDAYEGLRVLQVLDACQKSLNNGSGSINLNKLDKLEKLNKPNKLNKLNKHSFYVHESAYVDEGVEIGEGTSIWHFSHILSGSKIGKKCKLGQNVVIGPRVTIGEGCKIQNNVSIYEGVTLEDHVFCGPSAVFTNVFNPRSSIPRMGELRPTLVKNDATIGANATIVCGHTIGRYAFIGAGATVTRDVPDYALVIGNPGRIAGWMCRCGIKLKFAGDTAVCASCGLKCEKNGDVVREA
ncbi:MAG: Gfo/Idh/MocA family oxidoreductase [Pseudomonadota bacterium]